MKINRTWISFAFVVVASSFCGTGCIAETDQIDDEQFDDAAYEVQDADTEWSIESTEGSEEDATDEDADEFEQWGMCGPKCRGT